MKRILLSTYVYDGPAYRFGQNIGNFKIETEATTPGRAKSNVLYRIKQDIGLDRTAKIEIIDSRVVKVEYDDREIADDVIDNEESAQLSLFDVEGL